MMKSNGFFNYKFRREIPLYMMLLPGVVILLIYSYIPMYGIIIAFQRFNPVQGLFGQQKFIGFDNFRAMFSNAFAMRAFWNTIIIAFGKIISNLAVPIFFSILINEVRNTALKRTIQTSIYLPYFFSWVIMAGILVDMLAVDTGIVNVMLKAVGLKQVSFLGSNDWFRGTVWVSNIWKEFGFGTVIYLAAITSIDPMLYEAAVVDGANRWQQTLNITVPGMRMVIVLLMVINLGNVLNAGFDQIFNMYNPAVYATGDILDTYVYRVGLIDYQYGQATAVGLFKSVISFIFISTSYLFAYKAFGYRVF